MLVIFFVFLSSLPGRLWIDLGLIFFFGLLLVRIDEEPNYTFLIRILRHMSYVRRYRKIPYVSHAQREADPTAGMGKKEKKAYLKRKRKQAKRDKKRAAAAPQPEEDGQQPQTRIWTPKRTDRSRPLWSARRQRARRGPTPPKS